MKKIIFTFLALSLGILFYQVDSLAAPYFQLNIDEREISSIDGVTHIKIVGQINYMGTNTKNNQDIVLVTGDGFQNHTNIATFQGKECWGMVTVPAMIEEINNNQPNLNVIGGVNGDAYLILTTGQPLGVHIRDFRVINKHIDRVPSRAIGYKDNGEVIMDYVEYGGYHLNVFNADNELKYQQPVLINEAPDAGEIAVYFSNFDAAIAAGSTKHIFAASEIKFDRQGNKTSSIYFGEGTYADSTTEAHIPEYDEFVVVGDSFRPDGLLESGDYVIVQEKVVGQFADARHAMGLWHPLIINGVPYEPSIADPNVHPRTAVGIDKDGGVFFIVVDGRQAPRGMDGVHFAQLIELMKYFGAVDAYNLDGGGSSTFVLKDENNQYKVLNSPSDNRVRTVSNGMFFALGNSIPFGDVITWPDTRNQLLAPQMIAISSEGLLRFNEIADADGYYVYINGTEYYTTNNSYQFNLPLGTYEITVRAKGNSTVKSSEHSESIIYQVYSNEVNDIIELFKGLTKNK